jgi:hypothetical protein
VTQRHVFALFTAVWLVCGAILLNGAVIRIPPARPSAVRVVTSGVAATPAAPVNNTFDRTDLFMEHLPSRFSTNTLIDPINGNTLTVDTGAGYQPPTNNTTYLSFDGDNDGLYTASTIVGREDAEPITVVMKVEFVGATRSGNEWHIGFENGGASYLRGYRWGGHEGSIVWQSPYQFVIDSGCTNDTLWTIVYTQSPGGPLRIYRNNSSTVVSSANATLANLSGYRFRLGGYSSVDAIQAKMKFYGSRCFNRVLTASEIDSVTSWDWSY